MHFFPQFASLILTEVPCRNRDAACLQFFSVPRGFSRRNRFRFPAFPRNTARLSPFPLPTPPIRISPGLNGPDNKLPGNKPVDPRMQQQFRADVQKLFDLASELRDETQKSDLNSTLPISLVKKAQQIEKLARQIKDLAKG